jgi:hypothetical protein
MSMGITEEKSPLTGLGSSEIADTRDPWYPTQNHREMIIIDLF